MKYIVSIEEILHREVSIDADSQEDAIRQVHRLYQEGEIVLSADDYVGDSTITCQEND